MANPMIKQRRSPVTTVGGPTSRWRATLDARAKALQDANPIREFDVYMVGFLCAKGEPDMQMEARPLRDRDMDLDTATKAADRHNFLHMAHPQHGIDDMDAQFAGTHSIPGVVDANGPDNTQQR